MIDKIGARSWALVLAVMMMLSLVAALAIPIVLAEEFEKKTIDALVMAMPYREVIAAKAGLGLFYIAVMIVIFNLLTDLHVKNWPLVLDRSYIDQPCFARIWAPLAGTSQERESTQQLVRRVFLTPFIGPAVVVGQPVPPCSRDCQLVAQWRRNAFDIERGVRSEGLRSRSAFDCYTDRLGRCSRICFCSGN